MSEPLEPLEPLTPQRGPVAYRSPLLDRPGAVHGDGADASVAAHYGSIVAEQRTLVHGDGFVDLSHRDVVRVSGPDRLTWLHSLTTQYLEGLEPHLPLDLMILSPQGRIEHQMSAVDDGETFWMHLEPGAGPALVGFLEGMRFMMRVEVALDDSRAVIGRHDIIRGLTWELIDRASLSEVEGTPVGTWAHDALRIEAGVARFGIDTDERTIPNELGVLGGAVHLDKGCYRGQETIARTHNLGRPPRRLTRLHLDGSEHLLPDVGSEITLTDGGKVLGRLGSRAVHYELGPIGLALLKRNVDTGVDLAVGGVAASQEVIVDPDVGLHVRPLRD